MKKTLTDWQKKNLVNWKSTFDAILKWEWERVKVRHHSTKIEVDVPEDIRIGLLALHPNSYNEIIHSRKLTDYFGDLSMYELLTSDEYSVEESYDLIRLYLINYWAFLTK